MGLIANIVLVVSLSSVCNGGSLRIGDKVYIAPDLAYTWDEATAFCSSIGAVVPSLRSPEEIKNIASLKLQNGYFWLNSNNLAHAEYRLYDTWSFVPSDLWYPGYPAECQGQCGVLVEPRLLRIISQKLDSKHGVICELNVTDMPMLPASEPTSLSPTVLSPPSDVALKVKLLTSQMSRFTKFLMKLKRAIPKIGSEREQVSNMLTDVAF